MSKPNLCIAHSGGVTSILNTTAAASIQQARRSGFFGTIYAAEFGLNGLCQGRLFDTTALDDADLHQLSQTPSSAFGSCRFKLPDFAKDPTSYEQLFTTCKHFNIQHLIYQGGNDSQDTTLKLSHAQAHFDHPLAVIGLPKTIDNDLEGTDFCPGYPSAAKYIATSLAEAALDTWAMSRNSTQVFVLEVMGRHTGWLALASGIAKQHPSQAPHSILVPEQAFCEETWLQYVQECVRSYGHCVIVASEGLQDQQGRLLCTQQSQDAFGHQQLGGVGSYLAQLVTTRAQLKSHWALPDYLQRSAGHLRSSADVSCAQLLGNEAVSALIAGKKNCMLALQRNESSPVSWSTVDTPLEHCANLEKKLPSGYLDPHTSLLSSQAKNYLLPLMSGEATPAFSSGVPRYFDRNKLMLAKQPAHCKESS